MMTKATQVMNKDNPVIVNNKEMAIAIPNSLQVSLSDASSFSVSKLKRRTQSSTNNANTRAQNGFKVVKITPESNNTKNF